MEGTQPCSGVSVTVFGNSIDHTDNGHDLYMVWPELLAQELEAEFAGAEVLDLTLRGSTIEIPSPWGVPTLMDAAAGIDSLIGPDQRSRSVAVISPSIIDLQVDDGPDMVAAYHAANGLRKAHDLLSEAGFFDVIVLPMVPVAQVVNDSRLADYDINARVAAIN